MSLLTLFVAKYWDSELSMSYTINRYNGSFLVTVPDGTVNTGATSLSLVGRAVTEYGRPENENYVYLLENFAGSTPPDYPLLGQLWYNSATDVISTYNSANTWSALASQDYVQAQKISPALTGVPTAPTAAAGTSNTQIATTAFVSQSPQFFGAPTATTADYNDGSLRIATTAFVQGEKVSPVFSGTPTATTATFNDSTTRIATTAFVQGEKVSPQFTGVPTAPTATVGVSNTQIATTRFVTDYANAMPTMSKQNANAVTITGGSITGITPISLTYGGTGSSTASGARTALQLGNIAVMNASNVAFTGGTAANLVISGGTVLNLDSAMAITDGGTGANTAAGARTNLGLGSMSTQSSSAVSITGGSITGISAFGSNNVTITGGSITGITPLAVDAGGTGADTAANARNSLGVAASAITISAGSGLTGGGNLTANRTLSIASDSNGYGTRTVSTLAPSGGANGDIWYQV